MNMSRHIIWFEGENIKLTNKTFKACLEAMTQLDIQGNMCIFQEMNRTVDDVGIKNIWVTEDYSSVPKSFALNI